MADTTSIRIIGNWKNQMDIPLRESLYVSRDVMGRSALEAVKHCIIVMAKMARSLTVKSKKNREIQGRGAGVHVDIWRNKSGGHFSYPFFKWMASDQGGKRKATWAQAKRIGASGLAKRSWMWGLRSLNQGSDGKVIPGVASLQSIKEENRIGYILQDRLSYITKAMPAGWESMVEHKATKQILATAARKLEQMWRRSMGTLRKVA